MTDTKAERPRFRFNFFKLNVADLQASAAFYRDAFGFEERGRIDLPDVEEVMLAMPGEAFTLVLLRYKDGRAHQLGDAWGPLGFLTRDIDAAVAHALAHGATPVRGPLATDFSRYAFVADPEGHQIELIQFDRPAPATGA